MEPAWRSSAIADESAGGRAEALMLLLERRSSRKDWNCGRTAATSSLRTSCSKASADCVARDEELDTMSGPSNPNGKYAVLVKSSSSPTYNNAYRGVWNKKLSTNHMGGNLTRILIARWATCANNQARRIVCVASPCMIDRQLPPHHPPQPPEG